MKSVKPFPQRILPVYCILAVYFLFCLYFLNLPSLDNKVPKECSHAKINYGTNGVNHRWRADRGNYSILLKNFTLLNGDGEEAKELEILVKNGIIREISSKITGNYDQVYNLNGRYLTPGLVDMHSHLGTDSWPEFEATSDTNEMSSNPVLPQLRSLDGINPDDLAFKVVNGVILSFF